MNRQERRKRDKKIDRLDKRLIYGATRNDKEE